MANLKFILAIVCIAININMFAVTQDKESRRMAFIDKFLADYQAAYQNEKTEYIRLFFSSDALMITETNQLLKVGKEIAPTSTKARPYKLLIRNREDYLKSLMQLFDKNDGINIGISHLLKIRHPKYPDIYGVYFLQTWDDSGNQGNLENQMPGYIFMMLDFRKSEMTPIIHVRTWQPKNNINKPSDRYSLADFRIISYK